MRQPLVAGNWKMNGSLRDNEELLSGLSVFFECEAEVLVCPPSIYLQQVVDRLVGSDIQVGMQNIFFERSGAYTGEISPAMAKDFGIRYVIVGHSERRRIFFEHNEMVAAKMRAVLNEEMTPILCVGETLSDREKGKTEEVVLGQIRSALDGLDFLKNTVDIVIAYEPVWAIGTGLVASSEQIQSVHLMIRSLLEDYNVNLAMQTRLLYGGSVKANNATNLLLLPDVDGCLVGGGSLISCEFKHICCSVGG